MLLITKAISLAFEPVYGVQYIASQQANIHLRPICSNAMTWWPYRLDTNSCLIHFYVSIENVLECSEYGSYNVLYIVDVWDTGICRM